VWRKRKRVARSEATERRCCLDWSPGPEERHEQLVWHERLWRVLSGLPRLWQALLVLHVQECWIYQQLAVAFGITERHAKYETNLALAAAQKRALELRLNEWR
jgi:DNA-directed RNA polymerase specialized sigma24 family protein